MKNKIRFYKTLYSVAWFFIFMLILIVGSLFMIADPKAVGVMVLYYTPTWVPIMILCIGTIIYSNKLVKNYEQQH